MAELDITRLLQSPLGQVAPPGERGDMVRVSDGRTKVYLGPDEFDRASEADLRALLASARDEARAARLAQRQASLIPEVPTGGLTTTPPRTAPPAKRDSSRPPSLTAPRRAGRPAERLW
ncbi:MAG TPA: hypothetical protein VFE65_07790 [Pseudonocardia sp.]|jgi:hypothetical protein|nr:hypothetical protein [Pseudonocardia sp.]